MILSSSVSLAELIMTLQQVRYGSHERFSSAILETENEVTYLADVPMT